MATTNLAAVSEQIQKEWSPIFTKQLRAQLLLGTLVNKDYQGSIVKGSDTVYVSQVNKPTGQLLTVGTDADSFNTEALSTSRIAIVADKRAVAAYEFEDLVDIQSLLDKENPEVMEAMNYAMKEQINTYLYSLINPSTSSPDHLRNSITDFNASELATDRMLAAQAKWAKDKGWWALLDPSYYSDLLNATTLTSSDYVPDAPNVSGQIAVKRFGFNILEDDSRGVDTALLFHPDFLHLVLQTEAQVKISDMHSQKKFGYVMSVDLIFGAKLGIDGDKKHIRVVAAASGLGL